MSNSVIIGIDEAGRGPLAGPVVAGAVHLACACIPHSQGGWSPDHAPHIRIFDSKQLTEDERNAAYDWITTECAYGIGSSEADEIDRIGILEATNRVMQDAVAMLALHITPTYILVDGRDAFWFDYPHSSLIKGDSLEPCIAAASIIAKVTRDKTMIEADANCPLYGFAKHKGYGSPQHIDAIQKHGASALHRTTFLHNILNTSSDASIVKRQS